MSEEEKVEFPLKRYLLFAGIRYYPSCAWDDFKGSFSSFDTAHERGIFFVNGEIYEEHNCDWAQIVDGETGTVVDLRGGWYDR